MQQSQTANFPSNARLSALNALEHCIDKRQPLDSIWAADRYFSSLTPSDRAFAQLLAKTVIRRRGQIDDLLYRFMEKPLEGKASRVTHTLRLGVVQLIWLKTPPHAAVHSSVEMTKQIRMQGYSGLVNAVLKRVANEGPAIIDAQDAALLNTPGWLLQNWIATYGEDSARQIAQMHVMEPGLDLTVKDSPEEWAKKLGGNALFTGTVRLTETRGITQLPGFAEGDWWVQDVAASIPARLLGDVHGKRVMDICAAPGGKTAQLAAAGAMVTAIDVSKSRMSMLKANLYRLKLDADCVVTDALKWKPDFTPDAILLDAPCSATGTLRRHPDVAWNRSPEDITRLVATQHALLRHTLDMLPAGGKLVYAVCSLQREEGEGQIDALLADRKDVSLIPIDDPALAPYISKRGELRTLPCQLAESGGMDGFYAALLTKTTA